MSYFKAKMHQIRYRRLQRSPDPLAGFKGPASKGRGEDGWREEGRAGRAGKGTGRERREREGKGIEKGSKGIGEGEEGKENGDRPPTIFGLKVALHDITRILMIIVIITSSVRGNTICPRPLQVLP